MKHISKDELLSLITDDVQIAISARDIIVSYLRKVIPESDKNINWSNVALIKNIVSRGQKYYYASQYIISLAIKLYKRKQIFKGSPIALLEQLTKVPNELLLILDESSIDIIFNQEVADNGIVLFENTKSLKRIFVINCKLKAPYLRNVITQFCTSGFIQINQLRSADSEGISYFFNEFEESSINGIEDINNIYILHIIHDIYNSDLSTEDKKLAIKLLFCFCDFLEDNFGKRFVPVCKAMREIKFMPGYLASGFYVSTYPLQYSEIKNNDKFIIYFRNLNSISTRHTKQTLTKADFSLIEFKNYRSIAKLYILKNDPLKINDGTISGTVIALNLLNKAKQELNSDINTISVDDSLYFITKLKSQELSIATQNDIVGYLRRVLSYSASNSLLNIEKGVLKTLIQIKEPVYTNKKSVSKENLSTITQYFLKKASESSIYMQIYGIFTLLTRTEMRPSQILSIEKSKIEIHEEDSSVTIKTITKTSDRKEIQLKYSFDILKIIKSCLQISDKNSEYLFSNSKKRYYTTQFVNKFFKEASTKLNIPHFHCLNLRETYMTTVMKYAVKNNLSELKIKSLTGHKKLRTTLSNYVDENEFLITYLEATYGIEIGKEITKEISPNEHIKDCLEKELYSANQSVSNHCGVCSLPQHKACNNSHGSFSCLVCQSFVTTLQHKNYFIKTIENLSLQIARANNLHEKEELTAIKTICGTYLYAIIQKEHSDDIN